MLGSGNSVCKSRMTGRKKRQARLQRWSAKLKPEKQTGQDDQNSEAAAVRIYLATGFWQEGGDMIRFSF